LGSGPKNCFTSSLRSSALTEMNLGPPRCFGGRLKGPTTGRRLFLVPDFQPRDSVRMGSGTASPSFWRNGPLGAHAHALVNKPLSRSSSSFTLLVHRDQQLSPPWSNGDMELGRRSDTLALQRDHSVRTFGRTHYTSLPLDLPEWVPGGRGQWSTRGPREPAPPSLKDELAGQAGYPWSGRTQRPPMHSLHTRP